MNLTTYGQALRFVLFVGAAMNDATPEQREVLDKKVRPLLEFYRSTGREAAVRIVIRDVLGQDWQPSGDFKKQIDLLKKKEGKETQSSRGTHRNHEK